MADRAFKLWRRRPGAPEAVFAAGTVDDDDRVTVTEIAAPFKLPDPGSLTLAEITTQVEKSGGQPGFSYRFEWPG